MKHTLRLDTIPADQYANYRLQAIFKAYKWDPQVEDQNTVAKHVVLMDQGTAEQLETWAEQLSQETMRIEEVLLHNPDLAKKLGLPKGIQKALHRLKNYDRRNHVRLMRFDFHPTTTGWAVSEVNSDVPGGLAEASILPQIASKYFEGYEPRHHVGNSLLNAFRERIGAEGTIALIHATSYADDRQVMEFLSDYFQQQGYRTVLAAPDHLKWKDKSAYSILEGQAGSIDGIIRFFPLEWFLNLPSTADWQGYFDTQTPSCNHPIAVFAQSKRLPLVWDTLGLELPTWRLLLPLTKDPREMKGLEEGWIYKPALGRVGEGILINEVLSQKESRQIQRAARWHPQDWVAQQRFVSQPLMAENQESYHLCVGVFTVDGKRAGFYGRISPYPRIDAKAKDIPLLVAKAGC